MFPHRLHIEVWDDDTEIWVPYWDNQVDGVIHSRLLNDGARENRGWYVQSWHYGRSTRNHSAGVCFQSRDDDENASLMLPRRFEPTRPHMRMRIYLDDVCIGEAVVPLRSECIATMGILEAMYLPAPIVVGNRLEIHVLALRDLRMTNEWECSGLHFRLI